MEDEESGNEIFLAGALFHLYLTKLGHVDNMRESELERSLSTMYLKQERT